MDTPHDAAKIPLIDSNTLHRLIRAACPIKEKKIKTAYRYQYEEERTDCPKIIKWIIFWCEEPVCKTFNCIYDSSLDGKVFEIHIEQKSNKPQRTQRHRGKKIR